jgi:hypothetical protein
MANFIVASFSGALYSFDLRSPSGVPCTCQWCTKANYLSLCARFVVYRLLDQNHPLNGYKHLPCEQEKRDDT